MTKNESHKPDFDWRVTSFEGSRREQLRRWAQLPLENILLAIEEMQNVAHLLGAAPAGESPEFARSSSIEEPPAPYRGKRGGIKSK
jgi:hypothetical protein